MNAPILKGTLALVTACVFFAVSAAVFLTRRNLGSALQALGLGCFGVMALTHVWRHSRYFRPFGGAGPTASDILST